MRRLLSGCASPGGRGTALCRRGARPTRASPSRGRSPAPAGGGSERAELSRAERGNGRRGLAAGPGRSFALPPLPIGRGAVPRGLPGAGSGRPAGRVPYGGGPGGPVPGVTVEELPAGGRGGGGAGAVQLDRPPAAAGPWARVVAGEKRPEQCGRGRAPSPPDWARRSGLLSPGPSCGLGVPCRCPLRPRRLLPRLRIARPSAAIPTPALPAAVAAEGRVRASESVERLWPPSPQQTVRNARELDRAKNRACEINLPRSK